MIFLSLCLLKYQDNDIDQKVRTDISRYLSAARSALAHLKLVRNLLPCLLRRLFTEISPEGVEFVCI